MGLLFNKRVGSVDVLSDSEATPFLYAHLKCDEGVGEVLNDSSGNGHDMTWYPGGINATAGAAGVWTANGLEYDSVIEAGDIFTASGPTEYQMDDPAKTSILACQFTMTLVPPTTTGVMIFGKADSNSDNTRGGMIIKYITSSQDLQFGFISNDGAVNTTTAVNVLQGKKVTAVWCYDGPGADARFYVTYDTLAGRVILYTPASIPDTHVSTNLVYATVGSRGLYDGVTPSTSDRSVDVIYHNYRAYQDDSGGSLPNNMPDIVQFLHDNPTANIPADWWS